MTRFEELVCSRDMTKAVLSNCAAPSVFTNARLSVIWTRLQVGLHCRNDCPNRRYASSCSRYGNELMNEQPPGRRLGRGLAALISDVNSPAPEPASQLAPDRTVSIELVSPNPSNPRRRFEETDLTDLAQSIRKHGVVQPVVVRPSPDLRAATRSSPARDAGGRRRVPGWQNCQSSFETSIIVRRWNWRLSKTSSALTSIPSRMRRSRTSALLASWIVLTCFCRSPKGRRSKDVLACGQLLSASARSAGSATSRGASSSSTSISMISPSLILAAARWAALIPISRCPRIAATLLRQV